MNYSPLQLIVSAIIIFSAGLFIGWRFAWRVALQTAEGLAEEVYQKHVEKAKKKESECLHAWRLHLRGKEDVAICDKCGELHPFDKERGMS